MYADSVLVSFACQLCAEVFAPRPGDVPSSQSPWITRVHRDMLNMPMEKNAGFGRVFALYDIRRPAGLVGLSLVVLSWVAGCATGPSGGSADVIPMASVTASTAGLAWNQGATSGMIVKVGDWEGTSEIYSWPAQALSDAEALRRLNACLDGLRMSVSFASPQNAQQPHFLRSATLRCIGRSGMPSYTDTVGPDATEYDVVITAGNVNDHIAPGPGSPVVAFGSPYLGAQRHIRSTSAVPATVASDVKSCTDQAAVRGVFTNVRSVTTPESSGLQATWNNTTIEPMVGRFDQCLRGRGYVVEVGKR